jgi:hypothetical protein
VELEIDRSIHDHHAASADLPEHLVVGERAADQIIRVRRPIAAACGAKLGESTSVEASSGDGVEPYMLTKRFPATPQVLGVLRIPA